MTPIMLTLFKLLLPNSDTWVTKMTNPFGHYARNLYDDSIKHDNSKRQMPTPN